MSLLTQPYSTINKWSESKLQSPMLGIMGDSPTTRDLEQLDQTFGTGASSVYIDNINKINQNPISQITSLINPGYFAANAGRGLSRLKQKDPEQKLSDIGLDALFALTGAGLGRSLMGAKVLAPATKYVPQALKTGKYLPRVGNAVTNLVTPSTALNAYFANHAFVPHTDPVTGETVQGFGTQAFNNIYDAIGKDEYGELKVDWDKISPELVNAYMAYSIGKHGLSNANQFSGNLLGKPSLLNIGKLTQPIRQPLQNFKNAVINPPKIYTHPTTGKIHYINSISDLPLMNNNRRGVNYKNGGPVLPKANRGLISRVTRSNYNPISYPIKKIGYKIAVQHAGHARTKKEIWEGIKGTSTDRYYGNLLTADPSTYGPGKRDLVANYFFGDETGFEPINYDFSSDKGLDAMVEKYGPLKAFLLNSEIGHGEPLSAFQLNTAEKRTNGSTGLYEPLLNFDVPIIPEFGRGVTPQYYLPDGSLNLDLLAKINASFLGREQIMESINHPELQQQAGYLKDRARARFNTLFDEAGTDVIPFEINFAKGARTKYPLYGENPVKPLDNVAGHMGLLKRLPNGEFDFVTRDLWSFRPEAYNTKWNMHDGFKQAQTKLMDMFGKPFVLTQTNPIKFKEGGLIKASKGKPVKAKKPIEIKIPKPENIRTNINKQLADLSFTNYLNSTAPETMRLIADLKSQGIVAPSIPEGTLVTYPNLLNLATKKGIQNALTFARYTEPSLVEGVSSSGTKTPLSNLDLKAYFDKGLVGDGPGMAMYSASHIPGMRYGRRDGLSRLPYKTMFIGNREQGTPESLDALYTFPSFSSEPEHIRKGIMSDTYGSYATLLRYPFDYSGSAMDMFNRFRNFENETAAQSQIMKQTSGREGASPGLIGGSKFSKPLEGWKKSGIDPVFLQSWMGPPETPIIGHPGQKVLEPLFTQTKPIIKEMEAEETALKKLYAEGKYEELINKLNDKIKSGDFGSPESNIEQIKIRQKEKSDIAPYIDLSKYDIYKGASKPYQSEHIDPQTGLISLEGDGLKNIADDALSSYQAFMDFGPLLDAARNKSNIVRTYYSPLKFKFKEGGELPKARFGKPIKLSERNEREYLHHSRYKFPSLQNRTIPAFYVDPQFSKSYWNTWNNLPQGGFHKKNIPTKPELDQATSFKSFSDGWEATKKILTKKDLDVIKSAAEDFKKYAIRSTDITVPAIKKAQSRLLEAADPKSRTIMSGVELTPDGRLKISSDKKIQGSQGRSFSVLKRYDEERLQAFTEHLKEEADLLKSNAESYLENPYAIDLNRGDSLQFDKDGFLIEPLGGFYHGIGSTSPGFSLENLEFDRSKLDPEVLKGWTSTGNKYGNSKAEYGFFGALNKNQGSQAALKYDGTRERAIMEMLRDPSKRPSNLGAIKEIGLSPNARLVGGKSPYVLNALKELGISFTEMSQGVHIGSQMGMTPQKAAMLRSKYGIDGIIDLGGDELAIFNPDIITGVSDVPFKLFDYTNPLMQSLRQSEYTATDMGNILQNQFGSSYINSNYNQPYIPADHSWAVGGADKLGSMMDNSNAYKAREILQTPSSYFRGGLRIDPYGRPDIFSAGLPFSEKWWKAAEPNLDLIRQKGGPINISNQSGYKNKMGGISMKLSKSEIDKYIKGGFIVEDQ